MVELSEQEKKNKRIAAATTAGVNALLLLLLILTIAWRAPDPPAPEYGIELNFGMDQAGSGEVQPTTPVGDNGTAQQEPEQSTPQETQPKQEAETQPEVTESTPVEQQIASKVESPVAVKEEKKETKPVEKPKEKPVEKQPEPKKEEQQKLKEEFLFKKKESNSASQSTEAKEGKPGNQGDDTGKTGDKGNPEGKLDANALYGKSGGGNGGSSIKLDGFEWPPISEPKNLPDGSNGVYEFEVTVDRNGEIKSIRPLRKGPSAEAERVFYNLISKIEFTPTGTNLPNESKGVITFSVRSK